jgi:hypothetical protein
MQVAKNNKQKNCLNCHNGFLYLKSRQRFCSRKCQNTYNARLKRQAASKTEYFPQCLHCNIPIEKPKRKFCCFKHKNLYNHKYKYLYKYSQHYVSRSPENFLAALLNKKRRVEYGLTKKDLISIYNKQNGLCAITKIPMTYNRLSGRTRTNISIDRIDNNKGYEADNIQLVCHIVNIMKTDMTMDELCFWVDAIGGNILYKKEVE